MQGKELYVNSKIGAEGGLKLSQVSLNLAGVSTLCFIGVSRGLTTSSCLVAPLKQSFKQSFSLFYIFILCTKLEQIKQLEDV